ncbi:MAG: hypothetical protein CBC35_02425 [Planctomycetes bacterium TMED75]|nr:hypothetical protein [Planctomycetaceae bacterium]OUU95854.1 MAG: hypothetical protein CBC35_02425 [Planctomycetes bacterium TMED75]
MHLAPSRPPSVTTIRFRRVCSWFAALVCLLVLALVVVAPIAWLVGDTSLWWQRLSWIPAILLVPPLLLALVLSIWMDGRWGRALRAALWLGLLFSVAWVSGVDFGMFRARPAQAGDLELVHWNAGSRWGLEVTAPVVNDFRALDPDLLIITNPGTMSWSGTTRTFSESWPHTARNYATHVLSRFPIQTCRVILASAGCQVVLIELELQGRLLRIWTVDLPSDPTLVRGTLFANLAARLDSLQLDPPDLVLGDFNVPRNSLSLQRTFSSMQNAFDLVGVGWHGTWPARLPLWQLDQVLLSDRVEGIRYQVFPTSQGAHRMQQAIIRLGKSADGPVAYSGSAP